MVSGGPRHDPPQIVHLKADSLARNRAELGSPQDDTCRVLVGCGERLPGQQLLIVDPKTCLPAPDGHVGEIWVRGGSVAYGYHGSPQATTETFQARLANNGEDQFCGPAI